MGEWLLSTLARESTQHLPFKDNMTLSLDASLKLGFDLFILLCSLDPCYPIPSILETIDLLDFILSLVSLSGDSLPCVKTETELWNRKQLATLFTLTLTCLQYTKLCENFDFDMPSICQAL